MNYQKLRQLKEQSNLTNQQIADLSSVPIGTVTRILSGQTDNPSFETISSLVLAMGGSLDEFVSDGATTANTPSNEEKHDPLVLLYREVIRAKNKWIKVLFICLAILVTALITILFIDILNPNIGFVRY